MLPSNSIFINAQVAETAAFKKESEVRIAEAKEALAQWEKLPPLEQMTHQEWQVR